MAFYDFEAFQVLAMEMKKEEYMRARLCFRMHKLFFTRRASGGSCETGRGPESVAATSLMWCMNWHGGYGDS